VVTLSIKQFYEKSVIVYIPGNVWNATLIPAGVEFLYLSPRVDRFWSPFSLL